MIDKTTDVTEHEANPEKSYVRNCYIEGRYGEDVPLFTKGWVAHLDGYAIIPKEKYEALLNEQGHARTASEQSASGALKVLREALMSFVKSLDDWGDEGGGGNFDIFEHPTEINITLDHLRDAKKALSTTSEAPDKCAVCGIANRGHHIHTAPFNANYHEFSTSEAPAQEDQQ